MNTYLFTWNPRKFSWDDFQQDWENVYSGNRPRFEWSCGNTKRIAVGDRVFMMRLGWQEKVKGLMLSGWVTVEPMEDKHWDENRGSSMALYLEIEPDILLHHNIDILFDPTTLQMNYDWYPQRSGVLIPADISELLEAMWYEHNQSVQVSVSQSLALASSPARYQEGQRILITRYQYERDPRARKACIEKQGTSCIVCGFNFGEKYGQIGEGFIHVYHIVPLSERDSEYEIQPDHDLKPVCPNCHAMLHRRSPPFTIQELKDLLASVKNG